MIRYAFERREPLAIQWEAFLDALRRGADPPVSGEEGYAALSTARAIQRSGERHEVVVPAHRERLSSAPIA
jgi:predicted dehydrogenase